jgi:uncharacterized protein
MNPILTGIFGNKLVRLALLVLLAAGALLVLRHPPEEGQVTADVDEPAPYSDGTINLAGRSISFELADTAREQEQGLSGREAIEENQGMLFLFPVPDFPSFWMRDMNFAIDIVWIKGDEVVGISADVPNEPGVPLNKLKTYSPKKPADRVLELKAGWAARNGLKVGDKIEIIRVVK